MRPCPGVAALWGAALAARRRLSSPPTRELEAKVRDVVGLYLNPPEKAIVLCVDEKSQIQALDRTAPILPLRPGLPEKATHDYVRHGTTTPVRRAGGRHRQNHRRLLCRHGKAEFLAFLKKVARAYPRRELHVVVTTTTPTSTPRSPPG